MAVQQRFSFAHAAAALMLALVGSTALAHQAPAAPAVDAIPVTVSGTVAEVAVIKLSGIKARYFGLKLDQGGSYALNGAGLETLAGGMRINATGTLWGNAFNVYFLAAAAQPTNASPVATRAFLRKSVTGTLLMFHKDYFDEGRGEFGLAVRDASGEFTVLNVAAIPDSLEIGMQVTADGTVAADGSSLDVETITILDVPPAKAPPVAGATTTNTVLVIPIRFSDTPAGDPFNATAINTVFQSDVGPYYQEVSYGQQLLNITVACNTVPVPAGCAGKTDANGWLQSSSPTPTSCDFNTMGSLADTVAASAGYDKSVTQNKFVYYVLPSIGACGWAGLAYVGYGHAWSNGYNALWVYGHELGHNFGLWHAGSLSCGAQVIGGSCSVSEYGDPFDVMGNIRQMHFNAMQKSTLNWIPQTSVLKHTAGTQSYQLSPIETGSQSSYAVTIQASPTRKYWIEFRQPIGRFDAPLSSLPNLGAQIRVSGPSFDYPCTNCGGDDTELLDMTPGSGGGFDDAALLQGLTYSDSANNVTIHVISATSTVLTLSVSTPVAFVPLNLAYTSVAPCRLVDTRVAGGTFGARSGRNYAASDNTRIAQAGGKAAGCGIPAGPEALALTLTAVQPNQVGNLIAYPSGSTAPLASSLNFLAGQIIANTTVVPIAPGSGDNFSIFNNSDGTTPVVVDVVGYFWEYQSADCSKATQSQSVGAGGIVDVPAACSTGYVAVGGGCSTNTAAASNWLARSATAAGDGYHCKMLNSSAGSVTVTADTMCCRRAGR